LGKQVKNAVKIHYFLKIGGNKKKHSASFVHSTALCTNFYRNAAQAWQSTCAAYGLWDPEKLFPLARRMA